ncbi:vitamin K-dependent gamma-carboxylase-like protein [Flavobacterium endophyticum]|uniref:Vitamin K-dependent gamma-carboxylase-like protein n=1 Tax=Flavobacterium endophyticum TaxID=1540163 RepID=A0A495MKW2_9FLAO|nr:HTTM domain-containing protein [Flavobacterium endophyticum]RKS26597.1 vitamin K-dependent gamma-carboxylase-like protein [Flavobacterium endophyticum]
MKKLFLPIDNSPLIIFRIFFGFLLAAETFGAILTGWVKENFIKPQFSFSHIGMEWLQPLPGYGMYFYFATMGVLGILVMLGWKYRWSLSAFTLLWTITYWMQKTSYNNHYYMLILVCLIMIFLPANRYASIDAKQHPEIKTLSMPWWCSGVMILQIAIVYLFATLSKFYPDWLDGTFTKNLLTNKSPYPFIQEIFNQKWFYLFIAYSGIAFDMLIVPMLLWKKTRTIAFIASLIFHLFNAVTLQIGIFPFFALSFAVFFYPPEKIRALFFKKKPVLEESKPIYQSRPILFYFFIPYFLIQILLPIRHWFIKGDVLWTEEGHRLSWRMMLRSRSGYSNFKIIDKKTKQPIPYNINSKLTDKQFKMVADKPDAIWQLSQRIKKEFATQGKDVSVFVNCHVSINQKPYKQLINPDVDMASAEWNYFSHNDWILLYDNEGHLVK